MKLADLVRPGVLRAIATATPATTATQTAIKAGSTVAKVATIVSNETVAALILAQACKLTGHQPEQLPEQLRADLLARDDARTDYDGTRHSRGCRVVRLGWPHRRTD